MNDRRFEGYLSSDAAILLRELVDDPNLANDPMLKPEEGREPTASEKWLKLMESFSHHRSTTEG